MIPTRLPEKAVTNEAQCPHIVELVVADDELDAKLSRQVMNFHSSRKIQARHGQIVVREGQIYFRWCFSDLETEFMEQFGGEFSQPGLRRRRRAMRREGRGEYVTVLR